MQNPPAKLKCPRFFKRTLALLIVLGAGVWGAACDARPRLPLRFLRGLQCEERPHVEVFMGIRAVEYRYKSKISYDALCKRVNDELRPPKWKRDALPGYNGRGVCFTCTALHSNQTYGFALYENTRFRKVRYGGLSPYRAKGWTTVMGGIEAVFPTKKL